MFLDLIQQRGKLNSGEDQNYAFGLSHGTYRGLRTVGHGGADAGYRANFVRFPEHGYSFVALCNLAQTNPGRLAREVADIYLEEHLEPVEPVEAEDAAAAVALADEEVARIEGVYWFDDRALAVQIGRHEDSLQLGIGSQRFEMLHTGDGLFRALQIDVMMRFEPATEAVERLLLWDVDDEESVDSGAKLAPFDIEGANLLEYVGDYESPELPVTYHLELNEGQLTIRWLKHDPEDLMLVAANLLVGDAVGSLRVQRDSRGEITGFILDSGRVRDFRFERSRR